MHSLCLSLRKLVKIRSERGLHVVRAALDLIVDLFFWLGTGTA